MSRVFARVLAAALRLTSSGLHRLLSIAVLEAKKRLWGDAIVTQMAASTKVGLPVDGDALTAARAWALAHVTSGVGCAVRELDSVLRNSPETIAENRSRRAVLSVRASMESLAVARDVVAWVGPGADPELAEAVFRCAQLTVMVLNRLFDGYVANQERNQVMAHFESVLKIVDAVKTYVPSACVCRPHAHCS